MDSTRENDLTLSLDRKPVEAAGQEALDLERASEGDAGSVSELPREGSFPGYEVVHLISKGGQGVVYKAIQKATKRAVALKVLHGGALATGRQRLRFEREIDLIAGLYHPNIVTVYDSGLSPDGQPYYAM